MKGGWSMLRMGAKSCVGLICAAVVALLSGGSTLAQGGLKKWSDESVRCVMRYAWQLTPATYTGPDGKTIVVDKTKRKEVEVPFEVGREAVETGRISALAESCGLPEELVANQRTFMRREQVKKRWTEQQMLYLRTVHLTTVMLLNGKLIAKDKDTGRRFGRGEKIPLCEDVDITPKPAGSLSPCTEKQKSQVRALVKAYINASPATKKASAKK